MSYLATEFQVGLGTMTPEQATREADEFCAESDSLCEASGASSGGGGAGCRD